MLMLVWIEKIKLFRYRKINGKLFYSTIYAFWKKSPKKMGIIIELTHLRNKIKEIDKW